VRHLSRVQLYRSAVGAGFALVACAMVVFIAARHFI
jgi:hypothetical protein